MLTYQTTSLFDVATGSIIVHACNSQGVWGSGIAKAFSERFPQAYSDYKRFCGEHNSTRGSASGLAGIYDAVDRTHRVGWIVTSHDYGDKRDEREKIKINTALALKAFCERVKAAESDSCKPGEIRVYSNKFNSGLFGVEWKESELILKMVLRDYPFIHWIVCDPGETYEK